MLNHIPVSLTFLSDRSRSASFVADVGSSTESPSSYPKCRNRHRPVS